MSVDSPALLLCLLQFICSGISVKYQASNANSGRVKLILYQGSSRHELTVTSCPLGLQFVPPQIFSCACVTGIWAFYDATCGAPFETIAGINHCFQLPLDVRIHQIINIGNPTSANADVLTFFKGGRAEVGYKFLRSTHAHSNLHVPMRMLSVGRAWMLSNSDSGERVCLDSNRHPFYEQLTRNAHAYCLYNNVSSYIQDVDFVSTACASLRRKIQRIAPETCFPYLDGNSEEICKEPAHVQAYQAAMDSKRTWRSKTFKRLADGTSGTTSGFPHPNVTFKRPSETKPTPTTSTNLNSELNTPTEPSSSNLEALGGTLNDQRPIQIDPEKSYLGILNKEDEFLRPASIESDPKVFELLMEHQHVRIAHALGLSLFKSKLKLTTMDRIFAQIVKVFSHQCPSVPADYLNLAVDTFSRLLTRFNYQHKLISNGKAVLQLLEKCENKGPAYGFLQNDQVCNANVPLKVNASGTVRAVRIPVAYESDEFEPILESVWKLTVHTLIYCNAELKHWVDPATEMAIAFSEMFSSEINSVWNRRKTVAEEYGGVLGDVRKFVQQIDACIFAATIVNKLNVTYARPPYKSTSPPKDEESEEDYQYVEPPAGSNQLPEDSASAAPKVLQKRQEATDFEEMPRTKSENSHKKLSEENKNSDETQLGLTTTEATLGNSSEEQENLRTSSFKILEASDSESVEESKVGSADAASLSRRRRAGISKAEETWRKQRLVLGFAYCLTKADELRIHFGQICELY